MLSNNIRLLRQKSGLTQKELANKLFVTSQAISRWEQGNVEPSITAIEQMAKIFNVSVDEIFFGPEKQNPENKDKLDLENEISTSILDEKEKAQKDSSSETKNQEEKTEEKKELGPVLAICEKCNRPIYDANEIIRYKSFNNKRTICSKCDEEEKQEKKEELIRFSKKQRNKSFLVGGLCSLALLIIGIIILCTEPNPNDYILGVIVLPIALFTFISCMMLKNNFVEDWFDNIASWCIHFPGLITTFDIDGLIWIICMKVLFFILGGIISIVCISFAFFLCSFLSLFVYPFALHKNIVHPEETSMI